jgi:hypothetical protein
VSRLLNRLRKRYLDPDALSAADEIEHLNSWAEAQGKVAADLHDHLKALKQWAYTAPPPQMDRRTSERATRPPRPISRTNSGGAGYERPAYIDTDGQGDSTSTRVAYGMAWLTVVGLVLDILGALSVAKGATIRFGFMGGLRPQGPANQGAAPWEIWGTGLLIFGFLLQLIAALCQAIS